MSDKILRLASYNIRKARGLDQRRDPYRIAQVINGLQADVVVLQEADRRLGQRVAALPPAVIAAETDFEVLPLARNDVSLGWHGNAVLLRRGLVAGRMAQIDLPGLEPRGAVRVDLHLAGAADLTLVAAHLGLRRRDRQKQLRALDAATADAAHCILAGDFNEWSAGRGFDPLAERFEVHAPGPSFPTRRPLAALDRVALGGGLRLHRAGVAQGALARRASDHLPIWAEIILPPAAPGAGDQPAPKLAPISSPRQHSVPSTGTHIGT